MLFHNIILSALLGGTVPARASTIKRLARNENTAILDKRAQPSCSSAPPAKSAPHKNFWSTLTREETTNVLAFLHEDATELNLTMAADAGRYVSPLVNGFDDLMLTYITVGTTECKPRPSLDY
jgi:primary-amine oxidase